MCLLQKTLLCLFVVAVNGDFLQYQSWTNKQSHVRQVNWILQNEVLQQRMHEFSPVMLLYLSLSWRKPAADGPQAECE